MKTRVFLFVAVVAFAGSPVATAAEDLSVLQVDANRLNAVMDESQNALARSGAALPDQKMDAPEKTRASIYESLVSAVLDYNVIAHQACRDAAVEAKLCMGPYLPDWIAGNGLAFSDAQLRRMTDETSARLLPLWDALCAKAKASGAGSPVCPME